MVNESISIPDFTTAAAAYGATWWDRAFAIADESTNGLAGPILLFAILVLGFIMGLTQLRPIGAAIVGTGLSWLTSILFLYLEWIYGADGWALFFLFFILFAAAGISGYLKNKNKEEIYET